MKKKIEAQTIITQADFAKRLRVDRQRVTKLIDTGIIIRRPDGRLNLEDSLARATAYLKSQAEATQLHSGKTALQARRLMLQCELLQVELDREKGKVHDRAECCQSLIATRAAESRIIQTIAGRIMAQFPELANTKVRAALLQETDEVLRQLHDGTAYDVTLYCPHCHTRVDHLDAQPKETTPTKEHQA